MRKPVLQSNLEQGARLAWSFLLRGVILAVIWGFTRMLLDLAFIVFNAYHHMGPWIFMIPSILVGGIAYFSAIGRRAIAAKAQGGALVSRNPKIIFAVFAGCIVLIVPVYYLTTPYQACIRDHVDYDEAHTRFPTSATSEVELQNFVREDCRQRMPGLS